MYNIDEKVLLFTLSTKLKGNAKRWFDSLPITGRSLDNFKCQLIDFFPSSIDEVDVHDQLRARVRKASEDGEAYFHAMVMIASRGKVSESATIRYITRGFNDERFINSLLATPVYTQRDLLQRIRWYDNLSGDVGKKSLQPSSQKVEQPAAPQRQLQQGTRNPRVCFACRATGHIAANCPKRQATCEVCRRVHTTGQPECVRSIQRLDSVEASNFRCKVTIDNISFWAFADWGAQCTLITRTAAAKLKVELKECYLALKGFAGGTSCAVEKFFAVLNLGLASAETDIYVVEDDFLDVPMLIGRDVLAQPHIRVVVEGGKMSIEEIREIRPKRGKPLSEADVNIYPDIVKDEKLMVLKAVSSNASGGRAARSTSGL